MPRPFRAASVWSGLAAALIAGTALAQSGTLPTGKRITLPPLGSQQNVGSLPMNMIATPDGKYAVVSDMGFREKLSVVRTSDGAVTSALFLGNPILGTNPDGLYYGLAVKANGSGGYTLYAARGAATNPDGTQPGIGIYNIDAGGVLTHTGDIIVRHGDFPAGLALDGRGYLYVANNEYFALQSTAAQAVPDAVNNVISPGQLVIYDTNNGNAEINRVVLGSAQFSSFPLAVAAAGTKAYVTSQRDGAVYVVDAGTPTAKSLPVTVIPTGAHPAGLIVSGTTLYVSNAHSDTISVIDTGANTVSRTISVRPDAFVADPTLKTALASLPGVSPLGLALSPDGRTLYAALGDMNAVGVINLAAGKLMGYIPTGWYPTAVVSAPYRQILVVNAKGTQTRYPNPAYKQYDFGNNPIYDPNMGYDPNLLNPKGNPYDLNLIEGTVQLLSLPNATQQVQDTQQVLANNRLSGIGPNLLPAQALAGIKHVIYIVKENRTYDQVLGDLLQGDGDPSLVLFGQNVTPNLHALAQRFVLLDNFYDCAEASGDGWPWSTQSLATEYVIKNLPYNYSDRGRDYDFEGANNNYPVGGVPAADPYGSPTVAAASPFAGGSPAIPDVSEAPNHHIWDLAQAHGVSYRNYGFMYTFGDGTYTYAADGKSYAYTPGLVPDNSPGPVGLRPGGYIASTTGPVDFSHMGVSDVDFREFDGDYADSDAPAQAGSPYPKPVFGHYAQQSRFAEWNREFQLMLQQGRTDNAANSASPLDKYVPQFMTVRFMKDHTQGVQSGRHTPAAEVADNDYAVGQLVQAVSLSPIWNSTAIFVIEDDAQDGPDHVDCHRSTCYAISPFIKRGSVDHTFYNTDSVLKTMELLLGLPPMSQYDAVATPILDFDTAPNNSASYAVQMPSSLVSQVAHIPSKRSPLYKLAQMTQGMDFSQEDKAPAQLLNEVIWKSVKGSNSKMPAPHHRVVPVNTAKAVKGAAKDAQAVAVHDADD
ncbi:MAG: hypothetical protein JO250_20980 [Armatimonadetes bacterium]|nr:hypothetical protein [Armatimonadota bacterium]